MVIPWGIDPKLREEHAGTEVGDGVYWFSSNMTNWHLIEDADGLTMVDAGLPGHRDLLQKGLDEIEADLTDIEALILTHADPDHIGLAEPLREQDVPVWVHEDDREAALNGGADIPKGALLHLWRPSLLRFLRAQMQADSASVSPISEINTFADGERLDVPGRPEVLHTPGHNYGHCAFWLEDRRVLFAGDALQTMDPLRGTAVQPEPERAANFNDDQAIQSARKLANFETVTLLTGHGPPWEGHLGQALDAELS